jgi:ABC-type polysaccharide/polyol phosphate export permease
VLYSPAVLIKKGIGIVVYMNPLASLIEVIRYPLLNSGFAEIQHYLISIVFVSVMALLKLFLKKRWGRFVTFWA